MGEKTLLLLAGPILCDGGLRSGGFSLPPKEEYGKRKTGKRKPERVLSPDALRIFACEIHTVVYPFLVVG
jgi:hypothetical protein